MTRTFAIVLLAAVAAAMMSCSAQNAALTRQSDGSLLVSRNINGGTVTLPDGATIKFKPGCKIQNAKVNGRGIIVKPNGADVAFENCTFNATFVNSTVMATNLGLVDDMTTKKETLTIKGLKFKTGLRQGTDNSRAWQQLAKFLSGSDGITITFNGAFYNKPGGGFVSVKDANNLTMSGGTVIMGFRLINCTNVAVSGMSWVGYHEKHDFPPLYSDELKPFKGTKFTAATAYKVKDDHLADIGIAGDGIWVMVDDDSKTSHDVVIQNCHFEMRQAGVIMGVRSETKIVRDVRCTDCTMSHIFYQPVGFHASHCSAASIVSDYCGQGVDISTCSNYITVSDSRFTRCATGPKQETAKAQKAMLHHNTIENCYFEITDDYLVLDGSHNVLTVAEGAHGDVFTVRNTTFDVKKCRPFGGVRCRTERLLLDNVTFNYDVPLYDKATSKNSIGEAFSVFGGTVHSPLFELNNVTINLTQGTSMGSLCFPHVSGVDMRFQASGLTVNGPGTVKAYFYNIKNLRLDNCSLTAQAATLFTGTKNTVTSLKGNTFRCGKIADSKSAPAVDRRTNKIL